MTLGFGDSPKPKKVYIGKDAGTLWYFYDQKPIAITAQSLTGYLRGIEEVAFAGNFGVSEKLILTIEADRFYQIQSGWESWFCRSFLLTINALDENQVRSQLTIEPFSNTDTKVIFCNLYDYKKCKIYHRFVGDSSNADLSELMLASKLKLGSVMSIAEDAEIFLEEEDFPKSALPLALEGEEKERDWDEIPF
jgi:hypothetical protein